MAFERRALFVALVAGYSLVARLVTGKAMRLPRLCPMHFLFGRSCPLCGLTRTLGGILRGDPRALARARYSLPQAAGTLYLFTAASVRIAAGRRHLSKTNKGE
jgi:Protein of unknown function (DUF2752)